MQPRLSLVTLGVVDLERSRRFYADGLGLAARPESVAGEVYFFDMGGCWLALWGAQQLAEDAGVSGEGSGFRRIALAHNVAARQDVDAVVEQVIAVGGVVTRPAQDTFYGGYAAYFADPDGFLWEVAWNPGIPELAG